MLYNGNGEFLKNSADIPFNGFLHISYSRFGAYAPLNTKAAFETGGFLGFDAIKGDIQISADNVLIMCHDAGYSFDADGRIATNYNASDGTLIRSMQSADILAKEHSLYNIGEHPCTVDDYLYICAKWGKIPFVTIRDDDMDVIAPLLVNALKRWNLAHKAIINSFNVESLKAVRNLDSNIWVNIVMGRSLTAADVANAEKLYPCTLSPYIGKTDATRVELQAHYDAMANIVAECRRKRIPVLSAGVYNRMHYDFMLSHYNGAQMHQCIDFVPKKKYFLFLQRENGAWTFAKYNNTFEQSGTITESDGNLFVKADEIIPTWYAYLHPTITVKCTTDTSKSFTAVYNAGTAALKITGAGFADGMKLLITVDF